MHKRISSSTIENMDLNSLIFLRRNKIRLKELFYMGAEGQELIENTL